MSHLSSSYVVTWFHIDSAATHTILAPACLRTQLRLDEHAGTFRPVLRAVALFFHPPANTQIIAKRLMTSPVTFSPHIGSFRGVPPVGRCLTSEAGPPRLRSRSTCRIHPFSTQTFLSFEPLGLFGPTSHRNTWSPSQLLLLRVIPKGCRPFSSRNVNIPCCAPVPRFHPISGPHSLSFPSDSEYSDARRILYSCITLWCRGVYEPFPLSSYPVSRTLRRKVHFDPTRSVTYHASRNLAATEVCLATYIH